MLIALAYHDLEVALPPMMILSVQSLTDGPLAMLLEVPSQRGIGVLSRVIPRKKRVRDPKVGIPQESKKDMKTDCSQGFYQQKGCNKGTGNFFQATCRHRSLR